MLPKDDSNRWLSSGMDITFVNQLRYFSFGYSIAPLVNSGHSGFLVSKIYWCCARIVIFSNFFLKCIIYFGGSINEQLGTDVQFVGFFFRLSLRVAKYVTRNKTKYQFCKKKNHICGECKPISWFSELRLYRKIQILPLKFSLWRKILFLQFPLVLNWC